MARVRCAFLVLPLAISVSACNRTNAEGADFSRGESRLFSAAEAGNATRVRELLDGGADANEGVPHLLLGRRYSKTPLMIAAANGHTEVVAVLVQAGARINEESKGLGGESALLKASIAGHQETVKLLLNHGADPNTMTVWKKTALMWAADNRHPQVVAFLLAAGADARRRDEDGKTALDFALRNGATSERAKEVVALLKKATTAR